LPLVGGFRRPVGGIFRNRKQASASGWSAGLLILRPAAGLLLQFGGQLEYVVRGFVIRTRARHGAIPLGLVPKLLGFSLVHASVYASAQDFVGTVADPAFQIGHQGQNRPDPLFSMNELAMNLAANRVDDGYLQFLVVSQAAVADVLRKLFAVHNRFGVACELDADAIPHRDAVLHIEEKLLHGNQSLMV
jgi:hypothetical protein